MTERFEVELRDKFSAAAFKIQQSARGLNDALAKLSRAGSVNVGSLPSGSATKGSNLEAQAAKTAAKQQAAAEKAAKVAQKLAEKTAAAQQKAAEKALAKEQALQAKAAATAERAALKQTAQKEKLAEKLSAANASRTAKDFAQLEKQEASSRAKLAAGASATIASLAKIGLTATVAATAIAGAFSVSAIKAADDFRDLSGALENFTGVKGIGDNIAAQARELAVPVKSALEFFVDQANSGIVGPQADELFARIQDLKANRVGESTTNALIAVIQKTKSDNKLDPGDLKGFANGGIRQVELVKQLATNLGKSEKQIDGLIKAGKIGADSAIRAALDVVKNKTGGQRAGVATKENIGNTVEGAVNDLKSAFDLAQIDFGLKLIAAFEPLRPIISDLATWIRGSGGNTFLTAAAESIRNAVQFVIDHRADILAAFESVGAGLKDGLVVVKDVMAALFGPSEGSRGDQIRELGKTIGTIARVAIPVIAVATAIGALAPVVGAIVSVFTAISTVVGIVASVAEVVGFVFALFGALPFIVGAAIIGAIAAVWIFRDEIANAFTAAWEWLKVTVPQIGAWLWQTFQTVFSPLAMIDLGISLIDGLIQGITGRGSVVRDALTGIARAGLDAFKNLFGIHSPSRVMAQMGVHTVNGFTGAVDDGQKDVETSMARTFSPSGAVSVATSPLSAGSGVANNSRSSFVANFYIDGAKDPQATANATADKFKSAFGTSSPVPAG